MNAINVSTILSMIELAPWYRNVKWNVQQIYHARCYDITVPGSWQADGDTPPAARFRIEYDEPDTHTSVVERQRGRWWYVEPNFSVEAVIKAAWAALVMSDEHRRREAFTVMDARIFDPHAPINWPGDDNDD